MAEIKSTMDLVMERAARFGKATSEELEKGDACKKGMQLTAEYLNGTFESLNEVLSAEKPGIQMIVRKGMAGGLLRNITLPRDEISRERSDKCFKGILELSGGASDVTSICQEMIQILGQYNQHRDQLRQQLEEQIRMQYEQYISQQGGAQKGGMKIDPTTQPKFREELARADMELNSQYNEALEQRKKMIDERF
jgi:hypothetical protein